MSQEYFDVCTIDRDYLGKTAPRGIDLPNGEYHVVVMGVITNQEGKLLLARRSASKIGAPGKWECSAGSVLAGETSAAAIVREIREELGLELSSGPGPVAWFIEGDAIFDVWGFTTGMRIGDLTLDSAEVDEAKFVTFGELKRIHAEDEGTNSLAEVIRLVESGKLLVS